MTAATPAAMAGEQAVRTAPSGRHRSPERLLGLIPFAVLGLAWWVSTSTGWIDRSTLASPSEVYDAMTDLLGRGLLQQDIWISLERILIGVATSVVLGVGLGLLAGLSRPVADILMPLAAFFNAISGIAWIPLAIVWFGLGTATVIFVLVNSVFFLIFFNTILGVRSVPAVLENAVLTLGGGRGQLITHVFLPGALPYIISGVRSGFGFGWRALIAAELIASTSGLGYLIYNGSNFQRNDQILLGILLIGLLWIVIDGLILAPFERWTVHKWGTVRSM
jgi:taurine transport system permease protein